jgi:tetratricopeptide (TPR) repeat protein
VRPWARAALVGPLTALWVVGSAPAQESVDPEVQSLLRRAAVLERAGAMGEAIALFHDVLDRAPTQSGAILGLERIYRRTGELERVLPWVRRAAAADPSSVFARQAELRVLAELGRIDELRSAGERWLRDSPDWETAYREYAGVLRRVGATEEAEAVLLRGRAAIGRPDALAAQLADLYVDAGRWADAASEWLALFRAQPDAGSELVNFKLESLGSAAPAAAGALIESIGEARTVQDRKLLALAALHAERPDEARAAAEVVMAGLEGPERQAFAGRFARAAARTSRPALVAWAYRQLLPTVVDDSTRWALAREIVQYDLSAGDTSAAVEVLALVARRASSGSGPARWASALQVRVSAATDPESAGRRFAEHMRRFPDDPARTGLALAVAESNLKAGRLEEAERVLETAASGSPTRNVRAELAALRGYLALYRGEHEAARTELEFAAAALDGPARGVALRILAFLRKGNTAELMAVAAAHRASREGQPLRALDALAARLEGAPASEARPAIALWAGELAVAGGDLDRAESILRSIPERFPESGEAPVALVTLAEALAEGGREPAAVEVLEDLIVSYPGSAVTPIARRRLAELSGEVPRS